MSARRKTCMVCGRVGTRQYLPRPGRRWLCERAESCRIRAKQLVNAIPERTTAVGGYGSKAYEMVEDLAERADWCARLDRGAAVADYVKALHGLAAMRTANGDASRDAGADTTPERNIANANRASDRGRLNRARAA